MSSGLEPSVAVQLVELLNRELGEGLYSVEGVDRDAASSRARVRHLDEDGQVVAGSLSRLMVPGDVEYYESFGAEVHELFRHEPIGSFEAVAVAPSARGKGMGSWLLEDALTWFRREGCEVAVAVSWVSGRQGSSAGMFRRAGLTGGRVIEDFYLADSLRDGWACPTCGGACHCAAQFFHRRL